jgi:SAM-dependent methyltransferase
MVLLMARAPPEVNYIGRELWQRVGLDGSALRRVIGVDMNPAMCAKAQAHAAATGTTMECHKGRMEEIPLPDSSVDVVISNGVARSRRRTRRKPTASRPS